MNDLLDATIASFLGPLRFSKLNVLLLLSVGPRLRGLSILSRPCHCNVDDYKAQIMHKKIPAWAKVLYLFSDLTFDSKSDKV